MTTERYPSYLTLLPSGELQRRAGQGAELIAGCKLCPRACEADRHCEQSGFCGTGSRAHVASYGPHLEEEDCLRGWRGSGTIFFAGCNLGCAFCQNWDISHQCGGLEMDAGELAGIMLELQEQGCHNINWVTPTHVLPQALAALNLAAAKGLALPIVYNTSAYDSLPALRLLDGIVDVYMPDFKIWDPDTAGRLLEARDYPETARAAIAEMHRQVGDLVLDDRGLARRGILLRHLVMPNDLAGTGSMAEWLVREVSPDTFINIMGQYHPDGDVLGAANPDKFADLRRRPSREEMRAAYSAARAAGLHRIDKRWGF